MKITTTYRGKTVELLNQSHHVWSREHSIILQQHWRSGMKQHTVEIQAGDLLKVAQEACKKLSSISGVEFAVCRSGDISEWVKVKS